MDAPTSRLIRLRRLSRGRHPWRNLPLLGKGLIVIAVPITALIGTAVWSYRAERGEAAAQSQVRSSLQVLAASEQILGLTVDVETGVRGYLLTGHEGFLAPYLSAKEQLPAALSRFEVLAAGDPEEVQRIHAVETLIGVREGLADRVVAQREALVSEPSQLTSLLEDSKAFQDSIRQQLSAQQEDVHGEIQRGLATAKKARANGTAAVLGRAISGIVAGLLALALFVNGVGRRVRALQDNARRLSKGEPLATLPQARDELGRLDRELARAASLLAAKNDQLRLTLEAASIALWEYDPVSGVVSWPDNGIRSLADQRPPSEFGALVGTLDPEDRQAVLDAFGSVVERGILEVECRADVAGSQRWFAVRGKVVAADGDAARVTGLVLDITGRKAAEQAVQASEARTRAVLASIVDAVMITDPAGVITSINPAMERLLGWTGDEVAGKPFEFIPMVDVRSAPIGREDRLLARAMSTEQPQATKGYEQFLLSREGDAIPFAGNAAPVLDEAGRLIGWVEVLRDVTFEREVDQLKSSLVSTVSHELRTPLTMIQGFSELVLTRNLSSQKSDEALRHINTSAQRLARLIDDLLTVSRIESGRTQVRAVPLDLRATLNDVVAEFRARRHVGVEVDPALDTVLADPDMVVQILTNLISNGVKYSPDGSPVDVRAQRLADGVEVSVTDHGIGMSEAEQARLFERFFRADREAVKTVGGTGLGLYITRHLVTLQGGQMRVTTKLGEGSTFAFTLPLAPADAKERAS